MKTHKLAFVDLETTGLNPFRHEIIEIGIVIATQETDATGRRCIQKVSEHNIQLKAAHIETADLKGLEVNKYHERDWSAAIEQSEGLTQALALLDGAVFIAQNVGFDWAFLQKAGNDHNIDFDAHVHYHKLDLASMVFGKLYHEPKLFKYSLKEMTEYFGVTNVDAHTALADARATFEVCKKVLEL